MTSHFPQIESRRGTIQCTKHLDGRENINRSIASGLTKPLAAQNATLCEKNTAGPTVSRDQGMYSLDSRRNSKDEVLLAGNVRFQTISDMV
jgi:hypothetical protein